LEHAHASCRFLQCAAPSHQVHVNSHLELALCSHPKKAANI